MKLILFCRELSFKKGDIIFVRRQVDKNWYEGEHNAMIGLFPFNYVEVSQNKLKQTSILARTTRNASIKAPN